MTNKFQEKQILAEVLNELYNAVEAKEKSVHCEYRIVGKKDTQKTDWRTGELLWEDEEKTIPVYEDDWQDVEKVDLTDEDLLKIKVYNYVKAQLEKMI